MHRASRPPLDLAERGRERARFDEGRLKHAKEGEVGVRQLAAPAERRFPEEVERLAPLARRGVDGLEVGGHDLPEGEVARDGAEGGRREPNSRSSYGQPDLDSTGEEADFGQ